MSEKMKEFLERLTKDEVLQGQFRDCKSPEEAFALAESVVNDLDQEEFLDIMTRINKMAESSKNSELSEEDLELVAGGTDDVNVIISSIVGVVGFLASAASI